MDAKGSKTYQIVGNPIVRDRTDDTQKEDIKLIMDQTGKTEEEAKKAFEESNGDIAEAILKLS